MKRIPKLDDLTFDWLDFPEDIIVETNAHCNLRCIMCPHPFLKRPKGEMDFKVFCKIIDEVAQENPNCRLFVALLGEPLLGKSLIKMLRYAHEKGINRLNLNTNATLLTPEMSSRILDCGIEYLHVSLDAATKETYDKIRIGGDFEASVQNLEYFLAEKQRRGLTSINVIAQMIIMDQNENEVDAFKEFWLSRGAIVKIRLKMGWGSAIAAEDLKAANVKRNIPCAWILRAVCIQWNGQLSQCDADYEGKYSPGNISSQTIKEVWQNVLAVTRKRTLELDFSHPPCNTCLDWSVGRAHFFYPEEHK